MKGYYWLVAMLLLNACDDQASIQPGGSNGVLTKFDGVAILGAFEGEWFKNCPGKSGRSCNIRSLEEMCALQFADGARKTKSDFLRPLGLESEGAAALIISGSGQKREGSDYGHLGMNSCEIEFAQIEKMEITEHPFAPPSAP